MSQLRRHHHPDGKMPADQPADGDPDQFAPDQFKVVINHEEQYSVWQLDWPDPPGWRTVGFEGSRDECLSYIAEVWTDMRPAGLRRAMEADRNN
jgi:MbtH protein